MSLWVAVVVRTCLLNHALNWCFFPVLLLFSYWFMLAMPVYSDVFFLFPFPLLLVYVFGYFTFSFHFSFFDSCLLCLENYEWMCTVFMVNRSSTTLPTIIQQTTKQWRRRQTQKQTSNIKASNTVRTSINWKTGTIVGHVLLQKDLLGVMIPKGGHRCRREW